MPGKGIQRSTDIYQGREAIIAERRGAALWLKIDEEKRPNGDLSELLRLVSHDPEVRVVVLTGTGDRAFCAGMDLRAFAEGEPLPPGTRSLAFTLAFQAMDRTLAEADVLPLRERIVAALKDKLGVGLRT